MKTYESTNGIQRQAMELILQAFDKGYKRGREDAQECTGRPEECTHPENKCSRCPRHQGDNIDALRFNEIILNTAPGEGMSAVGIQRPDAKWEKLKDWFQGEKKIMEPTDDDTRADRFEAETLSEFIDAIMGQMEIIERLEDIHASARAVDIPASAIAGFDIKDIERRWEKIMQSVRQEDTK